MRKPHCAALPDFGTALNKDGARLSPISQATIIRLARMIGRAIAQEQARETCDVTPVSVVTNAVELPASEPFEKDQGVVAVSRQGTTGTDAEPAGARSPEPQMGTSVLGGGA